MACSRNPTFGIRNITSREGIGNSSSRRRIRGAGVTRRGIKPKLISNAAAPVAAAVVAPRDDAVNVRWHDSGPPLSEKSFPPLVSLLFPFVGWHARYTGHRGYRKSRRNIGNLRRWKNFFWLKDKNLHLLNGRQERKNINCNSKLLALRQSQNRLHIFIFNYDKKY